MACDNSSDVLGGRLSEGAARSFLAGSLSCVHVRWDKGTGLVTEANAYARLLCGEGVVGASASNLFLDFSGEVDTASLLATPDERRLLSVRTASGLPESLLFRFFDLGDAGECFGEHDQGELRAMRSQLIAIGQELSNTVRELHKRNAELDKLNKLKDEFLGMAAHDLRSPIASIQSLSDILLMEPDALPEDFIEPLSRIKALSSFMLELLGELLDIVAIESGKLRLNKTRFDLASLAREAVATNTLLARSKGVSVVFPEPPEPCRVEADAFKLTQVFNNLLSNAIKFSPPGGRVSVAVSRKGSKAEACVSDNGMGVPEEDRPLLFKPFSKTRAKPTGGEKCTGLGLAICEKIVAAHGGSIWLADRPHGSGAAFHFAIPLVDAAAPPHASDAAAPPSL